MHDLLPVSDYYIHLFAARLDAYSRWTEDGWRPLREPLTPEVALAGLDRSGPSISAFLIAPPGVSHVFAIDFDRDDGMALGRRLGATFWGTGVATYIEGSRRGCHLWGVLDKPLPAKVIRKALQGGMQASGIEPDPKIELRPGSDSVEPEGLGHALRMPMMPHPKTGQRWPLCDPRSGEPLSTKLSEALMNIEYASSETMVEWAEHFKPPPLAFIPYEHRRPHAPFPEDESSASQLLMELWGVPNAHPGRSVRCPAHEDAVASLSILRDDKRVICKAPACLLNNSDHGRGTYELRKLAPHGG